MTTSRVEQADKGDERSARAEEIAAGIAELGTGGTPAFIRGYNAGYDDAYKHAAEADKGDERLRELAARIWRDHYLGGDETTDLGPVDEQDRRDAAAVISELARHGIRLAASPPHPAPELAYDPGPLCRQCGHIEGAHPYCCTGGNGHLFLPPHSAPELDAGEVAAWLDSMDGRLLDIFGLWVQGKRDSRWVGGRLIAEGHLARLFSQ